MLAHHLQLNSMGSHLFSGPSLNREYYVLFDTCNIILVNHIKCSIIICLFIIALPTEPLDLSVTRITYNSCELEWNLPSDIGDESISHYSIIGTPDDISDITEDTMITIIDLMPNTMYTFNVSANNSLGFGESASVQCTTTGNGKNY